MMVTTAMLADAATVSDGKLYVMGGGWNMLFAPAFPATHPSLALVLTFRFEWDDAQRTIPISVDLIHEDGKSVGVGGTGSLRVAPGPHLPKGAPFYDSLAQTFYNLRFESEGVYSFRVMSGDNELADVPIVLAKIPGA
jgi:hypothetical protein